jgi:cytochrome c oxidase subunit 1
MAFIPVFVGMLMLYFFHFILRVTNKWGGRFCKFHVYATISAYIIIAALSYSMSYSGLAGAPRRYYDYSSWESFSYFSNSNVAIAITFIAFLLLQLIFLIYFILRMLKKGK